jgi:hypothetical protein
MSMSWIESSLTRLEARLRSLIEGNAVLDGIPRKLHNHLERELLLAMKSGVRREHNEQNPDGWSLTAPDQYTLVLPALQAQLLLTRPAELDRLTHKLESTAYQAGFVFAAAPLLSIVADPLAKELRILVEYSQADLGDSYTSELDGMLNGSSPVSAAGIPQAFLIVNGLTTFPLVVPVINIGRDPSNQLHLVDMRISRVHAQLRLIQGRFVIFDLDSRGGTFVNGLAVSTQALNPGDVILLAGVPLVYGQDGATQAGYTQELPVEPPAPEVL